LISVEEKLARWRKEQGRGERVLGAYKGDKNVPLAQRGARGCGVFPKALTHKVFPEMAK
jgi:tryptophan 2,3-dioxygenase